MSRIVPGALVLLLATPALWGEDKPKPTTPAEQYQMLLKDYQEAMNTYSEAVRNAKTPQERQKVQQEKYPKTDKLVPRFIDLAEKNSKDPVALDALVWVMTNASGPGSEAAQARAVELLIRDHIDSDKLAEVCQSVGSGYGKQNQMFLRAVLEKNKNKDVQAAACLALAQHLLQQTSIIQRLQDEPDLAKAIEGFFGKETVAEMKKTDLKELRARAQLVFQELADKHADAIKPQRLAGLLRTIRFSGDEESEAFLGTLLKKDKRRDVQGQACLTLAQLLKRRADESPPARGKEAEKLRAESEKLFERAAATYADVKINNRDTIGSTAKTELFDLRHLSTGKTAPVVKGEDQDGTKFQLADYKGKVVLLDFWSEF